MLTFSRILLSISASTSALHEPSAATANPIIAPSSGTLKGTSAASRLLKLLTQKVKVPWIRTWGNSQSSECRRWVCLKMGLNGVYMVYQQLVNVFQRQHDELWDLHMDLLWTSGVMTSEDHWPGTYVGGGVRTARRDNNKFRVQWKHVSQMPAGFLLMNSSIKKLRSASDS